jgi:hypothetical protein
LICCLCPRLRPGRLQVILGEVAAADEPLIVLFDQQHAGEADNAASLGKMPTTSERRPISRLMRSSGFVEQIGQ